MSERAETGTRARQKVARQRAILAAATQVLGVDDDATVDTIAAQAGLAKGTVYNYFADKQSLVEAVTRDVEARIVDEIAAALPTAPPRVRLSLVLCAILKVATEDPCGAAILCSRLEEKAAGQTGIGRAIAAELEVDPFGGSMSDDETHAALTLMLCTMSAAMIEIVRTPKARQLKRAAAFVVLCMRAVGAGARASEAAADAAMEHLSMAPRSARPPEYARQSSSLSTPG